MKNLPKKDRAQRSESKRLKDLIDLRSWRQGAPERGAGGSMGVRRVLVRPEIYAQHLQCHLRVPRVTQVSLSLSALHSSFPTPLPAPSYDLFINGNAV